MWAVVVGRGRLIGTDPDWGKRGATEGGEMSGFDPGGSRVLVTGASRGIGEAIAREFAANGSEVVLAARSEDRIGELARELGGHAFPLDVSDPGRLEGYIDRVEAQVGPLDVLVNNAGVESSHYLERTDESEISRIVAINLVAPMRLSRQVLPGMIDRSRGWIVNISSLAAMTPSPGLVVYGATKAGLTQFSDGLRFELKGSGVGVTVAHLGPIDTEMWDKVVDIRGLDAAQARLRRMGLLVTVSPSKVARDVVRAVRYGRREVRHPKRLWSNMALAASPKRITEALLSGFDPRPHVE